MRKKILYILLLIGLCSGCDSKNDQMVMKSQEKIMYLTFDDGPSQNTEKVLEILDKFKVKATFFVTAGDPKRLNLIKKAHDQGHAIGVHTYSHDYEKIYQNPQSYFKDLEKMNDIIEKQIGHRSTIIRFPGGSSNTVSKKYASKVMSQIAQMSKEKGYSYYDWNASNGDGNSHLPLSQIIEMGKEEIKGKDVVMMLMHDAGNCHNTVQALPILLQHYQNEGYIFKVINDATPVFHHHIAN